MGLDINYFYSLTPRQFQNIQIGYNQRRDAESKERILLTRKVMYAALKANYNISSEQDVWPLEFEQEQLNKLSIEEELQIAQALEESIKFWERIDSVKQQKAQC